MPPHQTFSPEFKEAVQLFVKSPQSKLVRYICANMVEDANYALHNRLNIMRVIRDVLKVQGFNPEIAFDGTDLSLLISEAAIKLKIMTRNQCRALF